MRELSFHLPVFEGPPDLLLYLISKHKLNICDIEISTLLDQYLDYMKRCAECDYELAGEFLQMAARLILLKTAALLPEPEKAREDKKDLEGELIEYARCKQAAAALRARWEGDKIFVRAAPPALPVDKTYRRTHPKETLLEVYQSMGQRMTPAAAREEELREKILRATTPQARVASVAEKVVFLLRQFYTDETVSVPELFEGLSARTDRVALFLAILELVKAGRLTLSDDGREVTIQGRDALLSGARQRGAAR